MSYPSLDLCEGPDDVNGAPPDGVSATSWSPASVYGMAATSSPHLSSGILLKADSCYPEWVFVEMPGLEGTPNLDNQSDFFLDFPL